MLVGLYYCYFDAAKVVILFEMTKSFDKNLSFIKTFYQLTTNMEMFLTFNLYNL